MYSVLTSNDLVTYLLPSPSCFDCLLIAHIVGSTLIVSSPEP